MAVVTTFAQQRTHLQCAMDAYYACMFNYPAMHSPGLLQKLPMAYCFQKHFVNL